EGMSWMERPDEGGYQWQSAEHVEGWLAALAGGRPERAEAFGRMLELLTFAPGAALRFLDLGAGAGGVAGVLLERFPGATALLADFSAPMMEAGYTRLAAFEGRYRYVEFDMNVDAWPADLAGPFDAAVSSQAIHHLPNARKGWLFGQVRERLVPGGLFLNWDPVRDPAQPLDEEDHHSRTLATLDEELALLREAGFAEVASRMAGAEGALVSGRAPAP
ncbi:MAG: class I SAM-dependent methyltransferase, partial [Chloroflexota bacterium]